MDDVDALVRRALINAHVVRGSAYPEHTSDEILGILGRFDPQIRGAMGASPSELVAIPWGIVVAFQRKVNHWLDAIEADARETIDGSRRQIRRGASKAQRRAASRVTRDAARRVREIRVAAEAGDVLPISRADCLLSDGSVPSELDWNLLLQLIGLTRSSARARSIDDPLLARTRPLFVLSNDRVLLGDLFERPRLPVGQPR